MHDLDQLLARRDGLERRLAHGLLGDVVGEGPRHIEPDVCLEQRPAELLEPLADRRFGQNAAPTEFPERGGELLAQLRKH